MQVGFIPRLNLSPKILSADLAITLCDITFGVCFLSKVSSGFIKVITPATDKEKVVAKLLNEAGDQEEKQC